MSSPRPNLKWPAVSPAFDVGPWVKLYGPWDTHRRGSRLKELRRRFGYPGPERLRLELQAWPDEQHQAERWLLWPIPHPMFGVECLITPEPLQAGDVVDVESYACRISRVISRPLATPPGSHRVLAMVDPPSWEARLAFHEHCRRRQERRRSKARGRDTRAVYATEEKLRRVARALNVSPVGDLGSMMGGLGRFIEIERGQPASGQWQKFEQLVKDAEAEAAAIIKGKP